MKVIAPRGFRTLGALAAAILALALVCSTARAGELGQAGGEYGYLDEPEDGLSVGGGIGESNPGYSGLHRQFTPFPLLTYRYGNLFFSGLALGYELEDQKSYSIALVAAPQPMRFNGSRDPQLAGMKKRQWSIDGGLSMTMRRTWGALNLRLTHDLLHRSDDTVVSLDYAFSIPVPKGHVVIAMGTSWENANFTSYYYGVSPLESTPTRPAYDPGSALNPSVSLRYGVGLTEHWRMGVGATYTRFAGTIRNSPIIDQSGSTSYRLDFIYAFGARR